MAQGGPGIGAEMSSEPMDWETERDIPQGDILILDFSSRERQILLRLGILQDIRSRFKLDLNFNTKTLAVQVPRYHKSLFEDLIEFVDNFKDSVFVDKIRFHFKQDSVLDLAQVQSVLKGASENLSVFIEKDTVHKLFKIHGKSKAAMQRSVEVIKDVIKEAKISVNSHIREELENDADWRDFMKSLETSCENLDFVFRTTEDSFLITGLNDSVKRIYEIVNLKTAKFLEGNRIDTHIEETEKHKSDRMQVHFPINSHDVFSYLKTFYRNLYGVNIEYCEKKNEQWFLLEGSSADLEATETQLNDLAKQITSKIFKFQDNGYFSQIEGQKFLEETVEDSCEVLFEKWMHRQDIKISECQGMERLSPVWKENDGHGFWRWSIGKKCQIVLAESKVDEASAEVVLKMVENKSPSLDLKPRKKQSHQELEMEVPYYVSGPDLDTLNARFTDLFRRLTKMESVAISVDSTQSWPPEGIVGIIIRSFILFFKEKKQDNRLTLLLCSTITENMTAAKKVIQQILEEYSKEAYHPEETNHVKAPESPIEVTVKKGKLHETELFDRWYAVSEMEKSEKKAVIQYLHMKGMSPKEILDNMKHILGDDSPSFSSVKNWTAEFKRRRTITEVEPRSGCYKDADILVNTTARDLCLSNGSVSRSLLEAAGEGMQEEIYTSFTEDTVLKPGEIAVTGGYNLKCKHVIHGVLCPFVNLQSDEAYKKCINKLMMESLEEAGSLKCRKIGFPAIGTGRLAYPTDVVAYEMFRSVQEFGKKHPKTTLKEVLFVIYPDDQQAFQIFKEKQQEIAMNIKEQSEYAKSWIEFRFIGPIGNIERACQHVEQRLDLLQSEKEQAVEIYDVHNADYYFMRHFCRDVILKLHQQGVTVEWKKGIVQVNGHGKSLSIAKSEIEQSLQHVLDFPRKTFEVRDTDITDGDYLKNRNTTELCHIYIPEEKVVVICGKNESLIEKEIQSLSELMLPTVQNVGENEQEIMEEEFSKQILVDDVAEDIYLVMYQKYYDDMDNYISSYNAGSQTAYVKEEYYPNFKKHLLEVKSYTKDFLVISCDKDYAVIREYIERSAFKDVVCICDPDQSTVSVFGPDLESVNRVVHKIKLHAGLIKKTNRASRELTDSFQASESPEPEDDKDSNESYSNTDAFEFMEHYKADSHTNGARPKHYYNQAPTGKSGFSSGPSSFMVKGIKVFVYQSDILHLKVDCIVNAANDTLKHGSGIAEVISKAAGPCLNKECQDYIKDKRKLKTGEVFVSSAGKLNYKRVIHAVGPRWADYKPHSDDKIIQCKQDLHIAVLNSLKEAERREFQTIAIPAISSSIFAVPKYICTEMYAEAVITYSHQAKGPTRLREIHFVDCNPHIVLKIQEKFREKLSADLGKAGEKPRKQRQHASGSNADPGNQTPYSQRPKSRHIIPAVKSFPYIEERSYDGGFKHELHCHFSSQLHLIVTEGSVFDTFRKVDSVVCSDKKDGRGKGFIAKTLLDKGGRKYKSAVEKAFKRDVKFGDVVSVNGEGTGFRKVLLAVMWDKDPADSEKQREDKFRKMFMSVFRRVVKEKHRTIVMPLLFTGKGKVKPEYCTERFLESCLEFSKQLHDNLTVYLVENEKAKTIKQVAKDFIDLQKTLILSTREQPKPDPERQSPPPFKDEHNDEPGTSKDDNKSEKKSMNPDIEQATLSSRNENCVICMDTLTDPKKLKCGHIFCTDCIDSYFSSCKKVCPTCGAVCGIIRGDQPPGRMDETVARNTHCAGYESFGTIIITYSFDSGRQGPEHPDPGKPYKGITRTAYLPDNKEGREVCEMLRVAFHRKLVFTIGSSRTTGKEGVITWNDIHHKTNPMPHEQFGYPDPGYLDRVKDELAVKGVTPDDIPMLSHTR